MKRVQLSTVQSYIAEAILVLDSSAERHLCWKCLFIETGWILHWNLMRW